jgi:hypothetical protein
MCQRKCENKDALICELCGGDHVLVPVVWEDGTTSNVWIHEDGLKIEEVN